MAKYRKKPVVIDAFLLGVDEEPEWFKESEVTSMELMEDEVEVCYIYTLEGVMTAFPERDYIIRGVNGEIYPCKADIFEKTYERVTDDD